MRFLFVPAARNSVSARRAVDLKAMRKRMLLMSSTNMGNGSSVIVSMAKGFIRTTFTCLLGLQPRSSTGQLAFKAEITCCKFEFMVWVMLTSVICESCLWCLRFVATPSVVF